MRGKCTKHTISAPVIFRSVFRNTCRRSGNNTALVENERQLSYGKLYRLVLELSAYLQSAGVCAETRVGVYYSRSTESVICLLAVLQAGGVYVPLDPDLPDRRIRYIIKDASPALILTTEEGRERLADCPSRVIAYRTEHPVSLKNHFLHEPAVGVSAADTCDNALAYILYTSGSTSDPKGVMVEYGALMNFLQWRRKVLSCGPGEVYLHKAPLSFDMSLAEILSSLLTGSTLVIARQQALCDIEYILQLIERHEVTSLSLVPLMLNTLLEYWTQCASIREVICGGDSLSAELVRQFMTITQGSCRLYNIYGPTECTVAVSLYRVAPDENQEPVPIGRPMDNVRFRINGNGLATESEGELWISGTCLARGYLNDAALTDERFVLIANSSGAAIRFYRTGDYVRLLDNGNFAFLGRKDEQVKLNGCRIETGEIESVLHRHPDFRYCAVVKRVSSGGGEQSIAYVVPSKAGTGCQVYSIRRIRRFLQENLPAYAWPSRIVCMNSLPVNSNGKVDKAKLRAMTGSVSAE